VKVDGAASALAASIVRSANAKLSLHRLADVASDPLGQDERDALFAALREASVQGGDLGPRLLAVYVVARTWFNEVEALGFVRQLSRSGSGDANPRSAPAEAPAKVSISAGQ